jgi:hypothetical protein
VTAEETRPRRAALKLLEVEQLRNQAKYAIEDREFERARSALNRARNLELEAQTLMKYATDEEQRKALVLELENGYH